jgi:hypothetical protein
MVGGVVAVICWDKEQEGQRHQDEPIYQQNYLETIENSGYRSMDAVSAVRAVCGDSGGISKCRLRHGTNKQHHLGTILPGCRS